MTSDRRRRAMVLGVALALQVAAAASLVAVSVIARIVWWRVPDWVVPSAVAACTLLGAAGWLWLRAARSARWAAAGGSILGAAAWSATYLALAPSGEPRGWLAAGIGVIVSAVTIVVLFRSPAVPRRS